MSTYTVVFLTDSWDAGISKIAQRARACCGNGQFVVVADEAKSTYSVDPHIKLSHDDPSCSLSLPRSPTDRCHSWNADYALYLTRRRHAKSDYYVLLENDVLLNCDLDRIIARCEQERIDLSAHGLHRVSETHWSRTFIRDIPADPWIVLVSCMILSCRAIDLLQETRSLMAIGFREGRIQHWPHCETFIPTVIAQHGDMVISDLKDFVRTDLFRSLPPYNFDDAILCQSNIVAHPVLSGRRFVEAILSSDPTGDALRSEGLAKGDESVEFESEFIEVAFGGKPTLEPIEPHKLQHFRMDSSLDSGSAVENLAIVLEEPASRDLFVRSVVATVHEKILGGGAGGYDMDKLSKLSAAIDSSQYVLHAMPEAIRFATGNQLRDHATRNALATGMILEFGVFSGFTINRFAAQLPDRALFGFDSFQGLPETWISVWKKGAFRRSEIPKVRDNVKLVVGWFDQTLPHFLNDHPNESVALLHIDCDLYSSTSTVFSLLADRIVSGTLIVFDEYLNYPGWRLHEYKAFQELVSAKKMTYEYLGVVPNSFQVLARIVSVG